MKFIVKASGSYTDIPAIHIQMFIKPIFKVLVGNVQNDTWNRALNRLAARLKILKSKVQIATKLHTNGE